MSASTGLEMSAVAQWLNDRHLELLARRPEIAVGKPESIGADNARRHKLNNGLTNSHRYR